MIEFWKKKNEENGRPFITVEVDIGMLKTFEQLIKDIVDASAEAAEKGSFHFEIMYVGQGMKGDGIHNKGAGNWCLVDGTRISIEDVWQAATKVSPREALRKSLK